jgi:hypothetical protein
VFCGLSLSPFARVAEAPHHLAAAFGNLEMLVSGGLAASGVMGRLGGSFLVGHFGFPFHHGDRNAGGKDTPAKISYQNA